MEFALDWARGLRIQWGRVLDCINLFLRGMRNVRGFKCRCRLVASYWGFVYKYILMKIHTRNNIPYQNFLYIRT